MAALMELLINDTELKTLMNINEADQENYSLLTNTYFLQTYVLDNALNDPMCVLLIRTAPKQSTDNQFVMFDNIIIEIFVHNNLDTFGISNYKRRIHLIQDRIIKLLNRKYVGNDLYMFVDGNELQSSTPLFHRFYVMFRYKSIYA